MNSIVGAVLGLLPKLPAAIAALKETKALVDQAKIVASPHDADTLDKAYELAKEGSDAAHADLQKLVAERTAN